MLKLKYAVVVLGVLVLFSPSAESPAWATGSCGGVKAGVDAGRLVPLERVISTINSRYPGEFLNACLDATNQSRPVYRVAWLSNGRKMNILVNARTGQIISA